MEIYWFINEVMDVGVIGILMFVMGVEGNLYVDIDGLCMFIDVMDYDVIFEICKVVVDCGEGVI